MTLFLHGVTAWTPKQLFDDGVVGRWYAAWDQSSRFVANDGLVLAIATGATVGMWKDKSGGERHLTQATSGSRPQYRELATYPSLQFDGGADHLFDTSPSLWNNGAYWVFYTAKIPVAATTTKCICGESNSASTGRRWQLIQPTTGGGDDALIQVVNDAGTNTINGQPYISNVYDDTIKVMGIVDTGSAYTGYVNGVAGVGPTAYTRSPPYTFDRFALGANISTTTTQFWPGHLYEYIAGHGTLSAVNRALLVTYLGSRVGLTI